MFLYALANRLLPDDGVQESKGMARSSLGRFLVASRKCGSAMSGISAAGHIRPIHCRHIRHLQATVVGEKEVKGAKRRWLAFDDHQTQ